MTPKQTTIFTPVLLEMHPSFENGLTYDSMVNSTSIQYPENDRHGAFITIIQAICDELIERYIGEREPICIHTILGDAKIKQHWQDFICHIREYSFPSVWSAKETSSHYFTEQKIVEIVKDILCILVLKSIGNLREDCVYETFLFRQMAQETCGLVFDEDGEYVRKDDKFDMFVKRHSALMQI